ncbi:sulfate permease [Halieaceae bacterium IMCC14734]|uniref:Sulfate permease n=1 Tax=Candidatus Litorirhabdus singularis TaxID=2518993 RepID=A0ABT3TLI9_9GAMM|nr:sulfate permease [Candidatus Litorirhabdus singularis]MCX2983145.1 sulfate permease [Candidatus Litorirhabdus singularis]
MRLNDRYLPGLRWLEGYNRRSFSGDLLSGITIAAMLIPQSMAYALVAGLPVEYGLYACIIPPIIYALLGTSNKLSIGPVALDSILILTGLSLLAEPGSDQYLEMAISLTLMVGLIQAFFGFIRFGFIASFLSYPVILGYTCAAAVVITVSQFESLLGVSVEGRNTVTRLMQFVGAYESWHWLTVAVSACGIAFLWVFQRWFPKLPSALLLLIVGMLCSGIWNAQANGIEVIAFIPQGLPLPRVPSPTLEQLVALIPTAFTVSLMGYVGSMSICKAQEKPTDKFFVKPNQELIAMGAANFVGAFFKAFPVSASFSRSAAFVKAGALTQVSAVVSSFMIIIIVLFCTPLFASYPLPKPLLAGIIVISVYGLFKYHDMKSLLSQNRNEAIVMLVTFALTILLGVQQGLLAGVILSIAKLIYNSARPHMAELGAIMDGKLFRNVDRFDEVIIREDVLIFRFDAPLFFANADYFVQSIYRWMQQRENPDALRAVIFDAEAVNSIDTTAIRAMQKLIETLSKQDVCFYITNAIGPVRDSLFNSPLKIYITPQTMFATIHDAISYIDHGVGSNDGVGVQTNLIPVGD